MIVRVNLPNTKRSSRGVDISPVVLVLFYNVKNTFTFLSREMFFVSNGCENHLTSSSFKSVISGIFRTDN